jgi:polysaccharide biosynthesis transport protein
MRQSAVDPGMSIPLQERGEIDLVALFREVGRRKWMVLIVTLAAFIAATAAVNAIKPRYTAETRVFLENRDTEYTRFGRDNVRGQDALFDPDAVLSQIQLVQSRDIARTIIQKLELGSRPEFDSVLDGTGALTKVSVMLGLVNNPASVAPEERVLDAFFDKLKVYALQKSRVLSVEFQSRDPALAAKVSAGVAEEYIRQLEQAKKGSAQSAGSWLGATIEPLRQRVAAAEAKVEAFRSQNGLFLVGRDSGSSISTQQLSELNTQLANARSQQSELSSKATLLRQAVRQGRIFEVSEVVNNESVRRLLESRATLRAQIAQEEQTLLPQHPRVKELRAQLGGLEEQIRASAERTARTLENDARAAGARVAAAQAELDQQKKQNGSANEQEVQLRVLEREAKAEREQLESYLGRYRDATSREGENSVAADARIVSRATVPTNPSFPKKLPTIVIATLAGLVLSLFWVLMRALVSDAVYSRRQPEALPAASSPPVFMGAAYPGMAYQMMLYPSMTKPAIETNAGKSTPSAAVEPDETAGPIVSDSALALRDSLERMGDMIKPKAEAADMPVADIVAPSAAPTPAPLPTLAPQATKLTDMPSLADIDPYNPLLEITDAAQSAQISGRPVSIIVLSVEGAAHAAGTVRALEHILGSQGRALAAVLEPELITPAGLLAATKSLAEAMDYVIFNGGLVSAQSHALCGAASLAVLVASDDLEDSRVDAAAAFLNGMDYFIISAESTKELQPGSLEARLT